MKKIRRTTGILVILLFFTGNLSAVPDPADELHALFEKIKTYEYGDSRENLVRVTGIVRDNLSAMHIISDIENEFIIFLESDASLPAKQFICEELSLFGTEKSLPVLKTLLNNTKTFAMALYALERMPGEQVNAIVRNQLPNADDLQKVALINALGNRKDEKSVKPILKYFYYMNATIQYAAIRAVGKIGGDEAAKKIEKALKTKNQDIQPELLDAYLSTAEQYGRDGKNEKAVKIFTSVYHSGYSAQFRHAALEGMLEYSDEDAANILIGILKSGDNVSKSIAIQLFHKIPAGADLTVIPEAFPNFRNPEQVQLLAALAGRKSAPIVKLMEDALNSQDESVRIAALRALTTTGDAGSVIRIARRAALGSPEEQKAARECLYHINAIGVDETILKGMRNAADSVKVELIRSSSERLFEPPELVVLAQVNSSNLKVRLEAIKALSSMGSPQILTDLINHLKLAENNHETQELSKTIISLCRKIPAAQGQAAMVINQLDALVQHNKLDAAYSILGNIGDPAALPILESGLKNKDDGIVSAAIKALSLWPDSAPLKNLEVIAKSAINETHHVLALRGFVRLVEIDKNSSSQEKTAHFRRAMDLARSKSEKKMVLSGIANVKSPDALKFVTQYFSDPGLKLESQMAALQIAENLGVTGVRLSLPVVREIFDQTKLEHVKERCENLINELEQYEDFIITWEVSGPFQIDDVDLLEYEFAPEKQDSDLVEWKPMPVGLDPENYWYIAFEKYFGGDNRVAYLRNRIYSDKDQDVILEVGSDDGNKIWINGELVHSIEASRECTLGEDKILVSLRKGWNQVLFKVTNGNGGWGACARFRQINGSKAEGLKAEI